MTLTRFDDLMGQLMAGQHLPWEAVLELEATSDILALGMLADAARRRLYGARTTYLRVATRGCESEWDPAEVASARELRITGSPPTLASADEALRRARAAAGDRWVSGFAWTDVERWSADGGQPASVLRQLREHGLDALAEVPLDGRDPAVAVESLADAGFQWVRLTVGRPGVRDRTRLLRDAFDLRARSACIQTLDPLPSTVGFSKPTTGYDDVKMVALARLAAPNIPHVQVDWPRYGPKLAQVALTFGADDVYGVSASEEAPDGRRRAALSEIRRNIEAAGLVAVERDGRFGAVS